MKIDKKTIGVIMLVSALAGFGGNEMLISGTVDTLDRAYVCPLTDSLAFFDRLSASGKTGYYTDEAGTEQSEACRSGNTYETWISLAEYAEMHGVSTEEFLASSKETPDTQGMASVCGREGCYLCEAPIKAYSKCQTTINTAGEIILP
jgi:hypothetical protein